jgi:hypothetical protein
MPYRVTFRGIGNNEALIVYNELEKKRGVVCACGE